MFYNISLRLQNRQENGTVGSNVCPYVTQRQRIQQKYFKKEINKTF